MGAVEVTNMEPPGSPGNSLLRVECCDGSTDELQRLTAPFAQELAALRGNAPEVFEMARKTLITLLGNILKTPDNDNFRTIHTSNQAIQRRVLSANGSLDFLLASGFVQLDDTLVFVDLDNLELLRSATGVLQSAGPQEGAPVKAAPANSTQTSVDPKRAAWLAEMKAKKQKQEAEKAALRAKIAAQREEQKHKTYKDSKAVKGGGSWQSATDMGLDGKAGG